MKKSFLLLIALFLSLPAFSNPFSAPANIKIAAFNIEKFGKKKMTRPKVVENLVKIVRRYDLIVIQEVRDKSGKAILQLVDKVNLGRSDKYDLIISPRIGRSSMKEQYAFVYLPSKLKAISRYQYPDRDQDNDAFHREPFIVRFKANNGFDFTLIPIHTEPKTAEKEISNLAVAYDDSVRRWGEKDALILGDFNAECTYVTKKEWKDIALWTDSRFKWLIDNSVDTTTKSTDCAYDRFVAAGEMKNKAVNAQVFQFNAEYGLDSELTTRISDHYPIEVTIK